MLFFPLFQQILPGQLPEQSTYQSETQPAIPWEGTSTRSHHGSSLTAFVASVTLQITTTPVLGKSVVITLLDRVGWYFRTTTSFVRNVWVASTAGASARISSASARKKKRVLETRRATIYVMWWLGSLDGVVPQNGSQRCRISNCRVMIDTENFGHYIYSGTQVIKWTKPRGMELSQFLDSSHKWKHTDDGGPVLVEKSSESKWL